MIHVLKCILNRVLTVIINIYVTILKFNKRIIRFYNNNNIYLLKSLIYIEYNTNSGYKWTPQEVIDLYML